MQNQIAILVVDDEEKILEVVETYLTASGYRVLTAQTGQSALEIIQAQPISLLLLDLMLPDMRGEEICEKVRETSDLPIIMMTAKSDEDSIIHGLSIGADDYVTKPFSLRELLARISTALRRSGGQGVLAYGALSIDLNKRAVLKSGQNIVLTPYEYKILTLLMAHPQRVYTRDEIIAAVMNDKYEGLDRAIDSHIKNLRAKIEDDPRVPRYIMTAYGMGYRFGGGKP